jgi:methyl-accepting chemotaxis protein
MHAMPDLWALERIARQLDDHSDDLRRQARRLATAIEVTRWNSTAAGAFRDHGHRLCVELRRGANRVDDAATALRSHIRTVRSRIAVLLAGVHALDQAAHGAFAVAATSVQVTERAAEAAASAAGTAATAAHRGLAAIGLP